MPINPQTDRYVLEGRVVTMGPRGVIPNGRIYLEGRVIKAVGAVGEALPADLAPLFGNAPKVATGGILRRGSIA